MKVDPLWDILSTPTVVLSHELLSDVPHISAGRRTDAAGLFNNSREGDSTDPSVEEDCDIMEGDGVGKCGGTEEVLKVAS